MIDYKVGASACEKSLEFSVPKWGVELPPLSREMGGRPKPKLSHFTFLFWL